MNDQPPWFKRNQLILSGILFGIAFYFGDAVIDDLIFGEASTLESILRPDPFEIYIRGAVFIIAVAFGVYAQILLRNAESEAQRAATAEDFLATVVQNIPDVVFVKDAKDLRFIRLNHSAEKLLGYTSKELLGKNDYDLFPQAQADFFTRKDREVLDSKRALDIPEESIDTRDLGPRILHTRKVPILDQAGNPRYLLGISEDITTTVEAEQELEKEKMRAEHYLHISEAIILGLDHSGCVNLINRRGCELLGYAETQILGKNWFETAIPEESRATVYSVFNKMLGDEDEPVFHFENQVMTRDGDIRYIAWHNSLQYGDNGEVTGTLSSGQDLTQRKQAEDQMRLATTVFENTNQGVIITEAGTCIISVNPAFTAITGYEPGDVIGKQPGFLRSGHHDQDFYKTLWQSLADKGHWSGEIWDRRRNGEIFPSWQTISAVTDSNNRLSHYVSVFSDITPIKEQQENLDFLAHHDPLTGLPNRLMLDDRLEHALKRCARDDSKLALLFLDLDRFKEINDSMGHTVGDRLLEIIGKRLQKLLRGEDTIARFGGDEFVIALETDVSRDGLEAVIKKVIEEVSRPLTIDGQQITISTSIGIAVWPTDGTESRTLLHAADQAMYIAKRKSNEGYCFFSEINEAGCEVDPPS